MRVFSNFSLNKSSDNENTKMFLKQLEAYDSGKEMIGDKVYCMDTANPLYEEIVSYSMRNINEMELSIWKFDAVYERDELERAVAFLPVFDNQWIERNYDNTSQEYRRCRYCKSILENTCCVGLVRSTQQIKKIRETYSVMKMDDAIDCFMVTPKLKEMLIVEGVAENYFRPMQNKKKEIMAYELISDNLLEEDVYIDRNYCFVMECLKCKAREYQEDCEQFYYKEKFLLKNSVEKLKPVNLTNEFYYGQRKMIVNRKMYTLIKKYVPNATFIPIFQK